VRFRIGARTGLFGDVQTGRQKGSFQRGGIDMDNMAYLVVAYTVFWVITFGLVGGMWMRQRRISREIKLLERRVIVRDRERERRRDR
jgi:hypothetical protein